METVEEPSYMMFARANVRDGLPTSPAAVKALLDRIDRLEARPEPDHTFRVTHAHGGKVAYEGPSYLVAAGAQYDYNVHERSEGREPLWRMWLVDVDGISCTVNTQQPTA